MVSSNLELTMNDASFFLTNKNLWGDTPYEWQRFVSYVRNKYNRRDCDISNELDFELKLHKATYVCIAESDLTYIQFKSTTYKTLFLLKWS